MRPHLPRSSTFSERRLCSWDISHALPVVNWQAESYANPCAISKEGSNKYFTFPGKKKGKGEH